MTGLTTGQKLKALRNRTGMTVRSVADAIGWPASTYSSYEDKYKKPHLPIDLINKLVPIWAPVVSREELFQLAGVDPQDSPNVSSVSTSSSVSEFPDHSKIAAMPRDLPVRGTALGGVDGVFELNGLTLDYVKRPPRLEGISDAYALYVDGESMAPWREHGQLVYVHPHIPVNVQDYVVVQMKSAKPGENSAAYIKRLVRRTERDLKLLQYNPRKEITLKMSDVLAIHKVLDWSELLST